MDSKKRKLSNLGLERRVRARAEPEWEGIDESSGSEGGITESEGQETSETGSTDEFENESGDERVGPTVASFPQCLHGSLTPSQSEDSMSGDETEQRKKAALDISSVSFGALAKAQASLPLPDRRRKKGDVSEATSQLAPAATAGDGSAPSRGKPKLKRTNKHAPVEVTSKRQVSRRRADLTPPARPAARDPRFFRASHGTVDEARTERAYAFLDAYRDDERAQVRAALRKAKDGSAEKDALQRALASMESRKAARARKDVEREVVADHRRREKELVQKGKKPFYLKKAEQKKRVLLDRFAGLKPAQVDRAIERRRKKVAAKERRDVPFERRQAAET